MKTWQKDGDAPSSTAVARRLVALYVWLLPELGRLYGVWPTGELQLSSQNISVGPFVSAVVSLGVTKTRQRSGVADSVTTRRLGSWKLRFKPGEKLVPCSDYLSRKLLDASLSAL